MKVIFLDIDGVLNCAKTPNPRHFPYIADPQLLTLYRTLVEKTGADTVLSSTWRHDPIGLLAARHYGIPFVDVIPDMQHHSRCDEIKAWLKKHPEVTRYLVLDDEDDQLDDMPVFQPSARTGLTGKLAESAACYLNGQTDACVRRVWPVRKWQNVCSYFRRPIS